MQWARVLVILSGPAGQRNLTYGTVGYQELRRKFGKAEDKEANM